MSGWIEDADVLGFVDEDIAKMFRYKNDWVNQDVLLCQLIKEIRDLKIALSVKNYE